MANHTKIQKCIPTWGIFAMMLSSFLGCADSSEKETDAGNVYDAYDRYDVGTEETHPDLEGGDIQRADSSDDPGWESLGDPNEEPSHELLDDMAEQTETDPTSETLDEDPVWPHWSKTYRLSESIFAVDIQEDSDGSFVVLGNINFNSYSSADICVLRISENGDPIWQYRFAGDQNDKAYSLKATSDGGYIVLGETKSWGQGSIDFWVMKLNSDGSISWQRAYGGPGTDIATSISETSDGFLVCGHTTSFESEYNDAWVLKLTKSGLITWQKKFNGANFDFATAVSPTSDDGIVVAGSTNSYGEGYFDAWVAKLSTDGDMSWQKTYGTEYWEEAHALMETPSGNWVVAGHMITGTEQDSDTNFWVLNLSESGQIIWQKSLLGTHSVIYDSPHAITRFPGNGFILAGEATSILTEEVPASVAWVLKLSDQGSIEWQRAYGGSDVDIAYGVLKTSNNGLIVAGSTRSFNSAQHPDLWIFKTQADGSCEPLDKETAAVAADSSALAWQSFLQMTDTSAGTVDTQAIQTELELEIFQQAP